MVLALKDLWFVGDHFLRETYGVLQDLKTQLTRKPTPANDQLHIYQFYNVVLYFASAASRVKSLLARVLNSVIEGLNNKERLPKYVVVLLDKDLIENLDYFDYGIAEVLDECVYWLVKEINKAFETRRDDLRSKRAGALGTATEPCIIWLAMIQHPIVNDGRMKEIYSKRGKFNRALKDAVCKFRYHHIMYTENMVECGHFDQIGKLTLKGKQEMWCEVIHQIKLFDLEQIYLKPHPCNTRKVGASGDE